MANQALRIRQVYENVVKLRGQAGSRQINNPKVASLMYTAPQEFPGYYPKRLTLKRLDAIQEVLFEKSSILASYHIGH